jgi:anti-anti-sigma factor
MINGVPIVTAPAEIDITTAEQLRTVPLHAANRGYATVVVDMTLTRFCDSAGQTVLVRAHKRAVADGGELRLEDQLQARKPRIIPPPVGPRPAGTYRTLDRVLQGLCPGAQVSGTLSGRTHLEPHVVAQCRIVLVLARWANYCKTFP